MFKPKNVAKLAFVIAILMVFSMGGVREMVGAFVLSFDKGLNPIPYSPPPPDEMLEGFKPSSTFKNGMEIINDAPGHYVTRSAGLNSEYSTFSTATGETVNSRLNAYATVDSYTIELTPPGPPPSPMMSVNSTNTVPMYNGDSFNISYDSSTNTQGCTLLMYPQVRDIIPPFATINSVVLITGQMETGIPPVTVEVYEIQSEWDPRTFDATTLPTMSSMPVAGGLYDLASPTIANRTIDITTTFNNWFVGISDQWGVMMTTSTGMDASMSLEYPLRMYIDYEMPEGSYEGNTSGASLYLDNVCPPMWIPRRSVYVYKTGILGDRTVAGPICYSLASPPFGYDIQGLRWVHGGKPMDPTINCMPFPMNSQTISPNMFNSLLPSMPPVGAKHFRNGNKLNCGGTQLCSEEKSSISMLSVNNATATTLRGISDPEPPVGGGDDGGGDDDPGGDDDDEEEEEDDEESEDPDLGEDDDPCADVYFRIGKDENGDVTYIKIGSCVFWCVPSNDPLPPEPQPDPDPPVITGSGIPFPSFDSIAERSLPSNVDYPTYTYDNMPRQWLLFDQSSNDSYSLDAMDTSQQGWYDTSSLVGRSSRATIFGDMGNTGVGDLRTYGDDDSDGNEIIGICGVPDFGKPLWCNFEPTDKDKIDDGLDNFGDV